MDERDAAAKRTSPCFTPNRKSSIPVHMPARPVVIVAQPHLAPLIAVLTPQYEALPLWESAGKAKLADACALVTAGEFRLAPDLFNAMPKLGLIACFTVGYDGIDVGSARTRGIEVSHALDANHEDVADHAIGMIIAQRRRIAEGDRILRAGGWSADRKMISRSLGGAAIGIVGLGSIGLAVARRAEAMNMRIGWWGPTPKPSSAWPRADTLMALASASDILLIAARAHDDNAGLVSAEVIDALGPHGLLVNVARGQLLDEDALIAALRERRIGGAALDVYATEPTSAARWADVPNTLLTPHTAGATDAAVARMTQMLLANLAAFFAGSPLPTPVR
jgi:lactate dehydrogenase-like 2-hydroxyacid dehydrogenase